MQVISTNTIMNSFVRKYSSIIDIDPSDLRKLFQFRPVTIDRPMHVNGATITFFYAFHSIPCLGFKVEHQGESIFYSGDTFFDENRLRELMNEGIFPKGRFEQLAFRNLEKYSLILHEAGGAPIHTTVETLSALPQVVKDKLYLYHIPTKQITPESGLRRVKCGLSNTIVIDVLC